MKLMNIYIYIEREREGLLLVEINNIFLKKLELSNWTNKIFLKLKIEVNTRLDFFSNNLGNTKKKLCNYI
jgi:hypothetical protein